MDSPDFAQTIEVAIRALTAVSDQTSITSVPSIEQGNNDAHAIGLGQMNLHGYLARERIYYGSEEGIDFTNIYFYTVLYHALRASNKIAIERGRTFKGFEKSKYASGEFFDKYTEQAWGRRRTRFVSYSPMPAFAFPPKKIGAAEGIRSAARHLQPEPAGRPADRLDLLHQPLDELHPPGGEQDRDPQGRQDRPRLLPGALPDERQPGVLPGRVRDRVREDHRHLCRGHQHVDQGLSLTLFFKDTATTRDVNKAQIYAWRKGIKTLYYIRLRQMALEGTAVEGCVSVHAVIGDRSRRSPCGIRTSYSGRLCLLRPANAGRGIVSAGTFRVSVPSGAAVRSAPAGNSPARRPATVDFPRSID